jgi:glycosyltransferase involved in cell wall biosynthesis
VNYPHPITRSLRSSNLIASSSLDNHRPGSKHLVFYDDARVFGGHEVSALTALKFILSNTDYQITFIADKNNHRLLEQLQKLSQTLRHFHLIAVEYRTPIALTIGNLKTLIKFCFDLRRLLRDIRPDLVIAVQGDIGISFPPLLVAPTLSIPTISFIPMVKQLHLPGMKLKLLHWIYRYLYRLPKQFITTSQSAKSLLLQSGVTCPIAVVYYGPDIATLPTRHKYEARQQLGIPRSEYVLGIIGRIQFSHKAHDFLVRTLASYLQQFETCKLYIVGDGPDELALKGLVKQLGIANSIVFMPWLEDLSAFYAAMDLLFLPSWHEGVPLVMLEAMYYKIPVIASNIDGMAELLPPDWCFDRGNAASLMQTFWQVTNSDNGTKLSENRDRIIQEFNSQSFGCDFLASIDSLIHSP